MSKLICLLTFLITALSACSEAPLRQSQSQPSLGCPAQEIVIKDLKKGKIDPTTASWTAVCRGHAYWCTQAHSDVKGNENAGKVRCRNEP